MSLRVGNVPIGPAGLVDRANVNEESFQGFSENSEPGEYCPVHRHTIPLPEAAEKYCCRDPACTHCDLHDECSKLAEKMQSSLEHH